MAKKKTIDNELLISRGERVKKIREMLKVSSEELARRVKFSRQSISYWENGRQNGLSYEGAEACIAALKIAGIKCDLNWLWSGDGAEPYREFEGSNEAETTYNPLECRYPNDDRGNEIQLFEKHSLAVTMTVKHNAMRPLYQKDDWVGGYWQLISPRMIGLPCIVKIKNCLEVRLLKRKSSKGYHFSFMTYLGDSLEAFEFIDATIQAAPIVRVWRKHLR